MISRLQIKISFCLLVLSAYLVYAMEAPQKDVSQEKSVSQKQFENMPHIFTLTSSFTEQQKKTYDLVSGLVTFPLPYRFVDMQGKFVVVCGHNSSTVDIINIKTGEIKHTTEKCNGISQVAFNEIGSICALVYYDRDQHFHDNDIRIIDMRNGTTINTIKYDTPPSQIAFVSNEELLSATQREYAFLNARTGKVISTKEYKNNMSSLVISRDNLLIAGSDGQKKVVVINVTNGNVIRTFDVAGEVRQIMFNNSNKLIAIRSLEYGKEGWVGTIKVFDISGLFGARKKVLDLSSLIGTIDGQGYIEMTFDSDENLIAVDRWDKKIAVMNTKTGTVSVKTIEREPSSGCLSMDGKYWIVVYPYEKSHQAHVIDVETGKEITAIRYPKTIDYFRIGAGVLLMCTHDSFYVTIDPINVQKIVESISLNQYELLLAFQRAVCDKGRINPTIEQRQSWESLKKILTEYDAGLAIKRLEFYIKRDESSKAEPKVERVPRSPRRTDSNADLNNDWVGVSCSIQ